MVVGAVLVEQQVVSGKAVGNIIVLQELLNQVAINFLAHALEQLDDFRQILPTARRHEALARRRGHHGIEVFLLQIQERQNGWMDVVVNGVRTPRIKRRLHHHFAQAVKRDNIELMDAFVVFGRVTRAHHHPVIGHAMTPERLELQELQHAGIERFGNAVNFIQEQNAT